MNVATEREAQIEGAKNLYRYNRSDIHNVVIWLAIVAGLAAVCWLIVLLVGHHPQPGTCINLTGCNNWILHHPVPKTPGPKGFPTYHPIN